MKTEERDREALRERRRERLRRQREGRPPIGSDRMIRREDAEEKSDADD